jgi:hypothetical protein
MNDTEPLRLRCVTEYRTPQGTLLKHHSEVITLDVPADRPENAKAYTAPVTISAGNRSAQTTITIPLDQSNGIPTLTVPIVVQPRGREVITLERDEQGLPARMIKEIL